MLYPFFLSSLCKVGKLQGHSWFPYSCAVLISSKPLGLSYPWTLLQSLCGFCCQGQGRQCQRAQMELRSTGSCPAWSSWTPVLCGSSCRRRWAAGMPVSASLKGGFQCCGFQAGDTSLCQSIAVPLPLHREWGEGEGTEPLCGVAVAGSSTAFLGAAVTYQWCLQARVWWEWWGEYWYMPASWNEALLQYMKR